MNEIMQLLGAAVGTLAFSVLFGVPAKYYWQVTFVGTIGMLAYLLLVLIGVRADAAIFFGTAAVTLSARFCAVWYYCPVTVFVTAGLFPLVPGGGIYKTFYYLITEQYGAALNAGAQALRSVVIIVLAIVLVLEIPSSFFDLRTKMKT